MKKNTEHNRRFFIKSAFVGLGIGLVTLWNKTVITHKKILKKNFFSFAFNANKKIDFKNDFIIINEEHKSKVLSSRCTHLGCKIDKSKNGQLLCPCHGSTFDLDGNATKGPATKPLEEMDFEIDKSKGQIIVKV